MILNRKRNMAPAGGLLLAGLAAFAYYKYSRMTPEEKSDLVGNLKEQGRKLFGQFMGNTNSGYKNEQFNQGTGYTG